MEPCKGRKAYSEKPLPAAELKAWRCKEAYQPEMAR